mmetsp:Transcript_31744/g.61952  ORF Transcript_31744/g.61952 Transcript_31744/m.61952 type:complete len:261 (+) Transcript_31744:766-1548(+)
MFADHVPPVAHGQVASVNHPHAVCKVAVAKNDIIVKDPKVRVILNVHEKRREKASIVPSLHGRWHKGHDHVVPPPSLGQLPLCYVMSHVDMPPVLKRHNVHRAPLERRLHAHHVHLPVKRHPPVHGQDHHNVSPPPLIHNIWLAAAIFGCGRRRGRLRTLHSGRGGTRAGLIAVGPAQVSNDDVARDQGPVVCANIPQPVARHTVHPHRDPPKRAGKVHLRRHRRDQPVELVHRQVAGVDGVEAGDGDVAVEGRDRPRHR